MFNTERIFHFPNTEKKKLFYEKRLATLSQIGLMIADWDQLDVRFHGWLRDEIEIQIMSHLQKD